MAFKLGRKMTSAELKKANGVKPGRTPDMKIRCPMCRKWVMSSKLKRHRC